MGQADSKPMFAPADAEHPPRVMVIAEIGVNHDGDPNRAAQLIRAAAAVGADAVKFQLFHPDRLLSNEALLAGYQEGKANDAKSLLEKLTLSAEQLQPLREFAESCGVKFIVTPFSPDDVADLATLDVDAVKIASPDAVNTPLLDAAAALGKPMLISTGTCELDELDAAAQHTRVSRGALLQCVSSYPTPDQDAALGGMRALAYRFPGIAVGYSDHTAALDTGALAVAAGAQVLEKHLTHDRSAPGPDHAASVEPEGLRQYVAAVRRASGMLGPLNKTCTDLERDVQKISRQSVCVLTDLPAGHVLQRDDLTVKRPGTGIPAAELGPIVGRTLARPVDAGCLLRPSDLASP
ncbi:N-acetylneuraminate synthase family protein [Algisphaera agarilytica]|uniref:Sialic acid synthase SpsE n=1 Tax=Algisphaera agarilytica TaxID=1385975 RepID=A0A7X0H9S2_9BACT|nr:N-acetylneuraminate synthase family protein [Algisphaera agarilytica]MBB6430435.1 sialic acid synthase SpsE [Algisphaera agarilytica]